jgi:6-phosphofructokinase 1
VGKKLADYAVHAAMAGKTDIVIGRWQNQMTHLPIHLATRQRNKIDPQDPIWKASLSLTRQESYLHPVNRNRPG